MKHCILQIFRFFVGMLPEHQPNPDNEQRQHLWLALTPHLGYVTLIINVTHIKSTFKDTHDRQSLLARKYIKYWAEKHRENVQFCESPEGEYVFDGKYK